MMKKFMKRLWEKKDSKKGFTLVELIVVLVILAILAAIMVPSLIGWINKAKEKEIILDARNSYLAAQELVLEKYAADSAVTDATLKAIANSDIQKISKDKNAVTAPITAVDADRIITGYSYDDGTYTATFDKTTGWEIKKKP